MCVHLRNRDPEGLERTLADFGHADGWTRPLLEGVVAAWRGDRPAALACRQRLQGVDPTVLTHGLGRAALIWHEDYHGVIQQAYREVRLPFSNTKALP